jgi:putative chitinase
MDLNLGDTQLIIKECRKHRASRAQAAYILATAYWETARTMKPVREAFWLSEDWRRENLRYYPWYGRGYVQLTWEENYQRAGAKLGLDLTSNADVVMQPKIAAPILVIGMLEGWFTGKLLTRYVNDEKTDFWNARRVVNAMDKANEIKALAQKYHEVLTDYNRVVPWWVTLLNLLWRKT